MTTRAAIFDLDGTLTATNEIDSLCYVEAFEAEFGVALDADWSRYRHCTDEGIAGEAFERHFGRPPSREEVGRLKRRFLGVLSRAVASSRDRFRPLPGAVDLVRHLQGGGWIVRIATGAWRGSADRKIAAAGLPSSVPVFACDDRPARADILAAAIASARGAAPGALARVVAVGDGRWDVAAAAELAVPFVGVAADGGRRRLHEAGARVVLSDFTDLAATVAHLESAPIPSPAATAAPDHRDGARETR